MGFSDINTVANSCGWDRSPLSELYSEYIRIVPEWSGVWHVSSPLANPIVRHGMGLCSAAILAFVAFMFLEGTMQLIVFVIAVLELLVVPQILKQTVQ